jgi:hypothetical protein
MPAIIPEASDAWDLWTMVQTQWRASGFGLIGLDYPAVRLVAEAMEIAWTGDLLSQIRAMESKTLEWENESNSRN